MWFVCKAIFNFFGEWHSLPLTKNAGIVMILNEARSGRKMASWLWSRVSCPASDPVKFSRVMNTTLFD